MVPAKINSRVSPTISDDDLDEIIFRITASNGSEIETVMPDTTTNRSVVASFVFSGIFAGACVSSKHSGWRNAFGTAAVLSAAFGLYQASKNSY